MFGYPRTKGPSCKPSSETEPTAVISPSPERTPMFSDGDLREMMGFDRDDTRVTIKRLPNSEAIDFGLIGVRHSTEDTFATPPKEDEVTATETDDAQVDHLTAKLCNAMLEWVHAINQRVRRG